MKHVSRVFPKMRDVLKAAINTGPCPNHALELRCDFHIYCKIRKLRNWSGLLLIFIWFSLAGRCRLYARNLLQEDTFDNNVNYKVTFNWHWHLIMSRGIVRWRLSCLISFFTRWHLLQSTRLALHNWLARDFRRTPWWRHWRSIYFDYY